MRQCLRRRIVGGNAPGDYVRNLARRIRFSQLVGRKIRIGRYKIGVSVDTGGRRRVGPSALVNKRLGRRRLLRRRARGGRLCALGGLGIGISAWRRGAALCRTTGRAGKKIRQVGTLRKCVIYGCRQRNKKRRNTDKTRVSHTSSIDTIKLPHEQFLARPFAEVDGYIWSGVKNKDAAAQLHLGKIMRYNAIIK